MKNKVLIIFGILLLMSDGYAAKSKKISVRVNNYNAKITSEEAKNLALNHSKVSKGSAKVTKLMLEKENKKLVYEVEFTTSDKKYKYGIDANTGKILTYSQKDRDLAFSISNIPKFEIPAAPSGEITNEYPENLENREGAFSRERYIANNRSNNKPVNNYSSGVSENIKKLESKKMPSKTDYIKAILLPEEKAREIILQNISGATDSDITRLVIKYENNRFIYSGKVNYNGNEYVIKLDGVTGKVVE